MQGAGELDAGCANGPPEVHHGIVHVRPDAADELYCCLGAGFPWLGLSWQKMENPHMRASMGMKVGPSPRGANPSRAVSRIPQEQVFPFRHF